MTTDQRLREAEVYRDMGMFDESLSIYEELLTRAKETGDPSKPEIESRIREIEQELDRDRKASLAQPATEEVMKYLDDFSGEDGPAEFMDKAKALRELGLFKEAADSFRQMMKKAKSEEGFHIPDIVEELFSCLIEVESPEEAAAEIEARIESQGLSPAAAAEGLYRAGLEMEKRTILEPAAELFRKALTLDPNNQEIRSRVSAGSLKPKNYSRYEFLIQQGLTTKGELQQAFPLAKRKGKSIESVLVEQFRKDKMRIGDGLSRFYGCPFKAFDPELPVPAELIRNLKKSFLVHNVWVPLAWDKNGIEVLIDDPKDLRKTDTIRALMSTSKIRLSVGFKEDILRYVDQFFHTEDENILEGTLDDLEEMIPDVEFEEVEDTEPEEEVVDESSSQVVKFVDQVLVAAFRRGVSDIHVEPSPLTKKTSVRFRQDGVCQEYVQVPNTMAPAILSRLKIMANLDIAEKRLPQDGKIKMKRKGIPSFELRMSTMPTTNKKEDAVLRILAKAGAMALHQLGLNERNQRILEKIIVQPYGLVLVVGPTGSGKTTTLHSALGYINKPEIKIWTAEDPVEITQAGLRQVEAKPRIGLDFARIMRGFLRLDPDVIMIGEMRDEETAAIGVEASLTGHLVFSTLHTNSAPETITRLLDMGLNPLNFSDAFLGVLAQRLLRRLCKNCKEAYHPSEQEFEQIVKTYGKEEFAATEIAYDPDMTLYRVKGCEVCSGSGYKGRMGIHELMEGTREAKRLIKEGASTEQLFKQAFVDGMATLKQDAIVKMFEGHTDMLEIRRVCVE
ncbi:MAG: GspE/PulE family protein [Desulfobacterales bacterium]|nr:GspE/PulE family protein [Desulfobacterales bacterium]